MALYICTVDDDDAYAGGGAPLLVRPPPPERTELRCASMALYICTVDGPCLSMASMAARSRSQFLRLASSDSCFLVPLLAVDTTLGSSGRGSTAGSGDLPNA